MGQLLKERRPFREKGCPVGPIIGCDDRTRLNRPLQVITCLGNRLQG